MSTLLPLFSLLVGAVAFVSAILVRQRQESNSRLFVVLMVAGIVCVAVSMVLSGFVVGRSM